MNNNDDKMIPKPLDSYCETHQVMIDSNTETEDLGPKKGSSDETEEELEQEMDVSGPMPLPEPSSSTKMNNNDDKMIPKPLGSYCEAHQVTIDSYTGAEDLAPMEISGPLPLPDPSSSTQPTARRRRPPPSHISTKSRISEAPVDPENLPGAFPEVPGWRQQQSSFTDSGELGFCSSHLGNRNLYTSTTLQLAEEGRVIDEMDESTSSSNRDGLVEAIPVSLPTEKAEPVSLEDTKQKKQQRDKTTRFRQLCFLAGGLTVLAAAGLIAILAASKSSSPQTIQAPAEGEASNTTNSTETINSPSVQLILPITLPESTTNTITQDVTISTPQGQAYQWLVQDPNVEQYTEYQLLERFAAATFYFATNGSEWTFQGGGQVTIVVDEDPNMMHQGQRPPDSNASLPPPPPPPGEGGQHKKQKVNITSEKWLSYNSSVCDWYSTASARGKQACGPSGVLKELHLLENNLKTTVIPAEIGLLTGLQGLVLGLNRIEGTFPSQVGELSSLTSFRLVSNLFTGQIPSEMGLLSLLGDIGIQDNMFSGTVPQEIWNMSNLRVLKAARNSFSGTLPIDLGHGLADMELLMLDGNRFTGELPTILPPNLNFLDVSFNRLHGQLPSELGTLRRLAKLRAEDTDLSGTIPSELGILPRLIEIELRGNQGIGGSLPSELAQLNSTLVQLSIEKTAITGTIPSALCNIQFLKFDCTETLCGCDCPCIPS
ncbi:Leucine Rich Repeat [Seminavis robusta]|uniref:Leucine Rich Repeat n=1 Tax=Seminavis robusta TaxID=568900 RepID=A0A9N8HXZ9_9STRA|nr:Leucine Rich Repeat [Seminavis robusta]|eukprot:Sro1902_g304490.1 Leucine Rich Repeat (714) ;mRNA; f:17923-20064